MPKVTDEYRVARREEITQAALRVIRRKGFQAASMADIITESGLSAGAIYGHYKSKADIVLDVARTVVGARVDDIHHLSEAEQLIPPSEVLVRLVGAMKQALGDPGIIVQVWGEAVVDTRLRALASEVFLRLKGALGGYLSVWYQREHDLPADAADAIADDLVPLYVSSVMGYAVQRSLLADFDEGAYLDMLSRRLPH